MIHPMKTSQEVKMTSKSKSKIKYSRARGREDLQMCFGAAHGQ
jgi:hypothetical protein